MGIPKPIHALSGHCSIVHENTIYVYSPEGFQSLDLKEGARWKRLPMDISLTGAQCVKAAPEGKLYIVRGSVNETATSWGYPGLMHYSFSEKKWDWVRPEVFVTSNRQNHAAVYMEKSKAILVYSGSQDSSYVGPSSETFLISTEPPFRITSGVSSGAPPAVKPMLMPWDEGTAVMFGGGAENKAVYLFGEGGCGSGVVLTEPFTNQDAVQSTVISGDDGSRVLEKYDMAVSPNEVTRIRLLNQGGTVASSGSVVKRVTIGEWAKYNGTLAPKVTRAGYSIAQGEQGLAIVTGGNDEDPLCIFDQQANSWVNATKLFDGEQVVILSTPSSTSASPTSTESAAASSSAAVAPPAVVPVDNKSRMMTVLGATLGAIFGIAAVLILILFCLKWRKAKNRKAQQSGYVEKKSDRLSFADRGAEFMKEAGGAVGPKYSSNNGSQTSLAIVSGQTHKRGLGPLGSDASTAGLVKKSPLAYTDPVELHKFDLKPEPAEERMVRQNSGRQPPRAVTNLGRSRSSGWSKYFANNEATNLAHMPSERSTYASERTSTGSQSMYTDSHLFGNTPQAIPPLDIPKFENQRVSRVPTGSPTLGNSSENLPAQPMQAELARANSNGSTHSGHSHNDYYARAPMQNWDPVGHDERPPSSTYTNSLVIDGTFRDGTSSYYPDGDSTYYPKSTYSSFYPPTTPGHERQESSGTLFPGMSGTNNGGTSFPKTNEGMSFPALPPRFGPAEDRDSTITVFPRGVDEGPPKPVHQDMSWLNLGAGK